MVEDVESLSGLHPSVMDIVVQWSFPILNTEGYISVTCLMLQVREVASVFSDNVTRWTAEALLALQEVRVPVYPSSTDVSYYLVIK